MSEKPIDLDAIRKRCEAATEGPWVASIDAHHPNKVYTHAKKFLAFQIIGDSAECDATTEFIAHARTDIPLLLAEVKRLTEEVNALQKQIR